MNRMFLRDDGMVCQSIFSTSISDVFAAASISAQVSRWSKFTGGRLFAGIVLRYEQLLRIVDTDFIDSLVAQTCCT